LAPALDGDVHTLRYVRMLVTANPVEDRYFSARAPPAHVEHRETLARANAAFVKLTDEGRENVGEKASRWMEEQWKTTKKFHCLGAKNRANWLLDSLAAEPKNRLLGFLGLSELALTRGMLACGPVIAECHMDVDKITQWCPTAGLLAGNIVQMRNLSDDASI
jgi:hypothetical protein